MAGKQNIPEKQPQGQVEAKKPPMDETQRTVLGKFDEKEAENVKKVEEIFEKRISGSKLAEVALNEVRTMKEQQKTAVKTTFARFKKTYEEKSEENKGERDVLAKQLLDEAQGEVEARIQNIQMILNMLVKGDYITEAEAAALKRTLVGIEKISVKDVETQEILLKLQEKRVLDSEDYRRILNMVNPLDLTNKDAKPRQRFEATTAGIMIGFMSPAQRYRLVEEIMDSHKSGQTAEVIDGFLRTGILTVAQGEELFNAGVQKKVIKKEEFEAVYKKRMDQGFYVDEVKKVRDAMNKEVRQMQGMYAVNMMDRVVGKPLLGAGMLLHSFFWILTNVLASGGDFKSLFKNPYIWAAMGEGALALEMTTGSVKRGAESWGIGSGWISRAMEKLSEKEGKLNTVQQNAFAAMGDIYVSYPDFGFYLEHGGAQTIADIRKAKSGQGLKGAELMITYEELLKTETDPTRKSKLEDANKKFPSQTAVQINTIAEALTVLKIENQGDFNAKLAFIKEAQGLKGGPAAVTIGSGGPKMQVTS